MALHKIKEFVHSGFFWAADSYFAEGTCLTSIFYQLAKLFADVTFTDIDGNVIDMDFLEIESNPTLSTSKKGKWLQAQVEYARIHSGDKIVSDYYEEAYDTIQEWFDDPSDPDLLEAAQNVARSLALLIFNKYKDNWCRSWYALSIKYRPLDNYDRKEVVDRDTDTTNTIATFTDDWNTNKQGATTTASTTYGFNSSSGVPTGSTTVTPSNNISATNSSIPGSQNAINESSTHNHGTDTINTDEDSTVTTHGNIGVTSTQKLLESELTLREKVNFYNMMYKDIDTILTCNCYGTMEDIGEI